MTRTGHGLFTRSAKAAEGPPIGQRTYWVLRSMNGFKKKGRAAIPQAFSRWVSRI